MKIKKYSEWKDTALIIHQISQMIGKTMLEHMEPQPQWNNVLLKLTSDGFSSELITFEEKSFQIDISLRDSKVIMSRVDGKKVSFNLHGKKSISEYYFEFHNLLEEMECKKAIYTVPQEMSITIPFEENHEKLNYDSDDALMFHDMCVFTYNAQTEFIAKYRAKKILPSFFWGTFDMTTAIFNGVADPFSGGSIIEKVAFDEQMIEFGFWPGDDNVDEPTFFILSYPFAPADLSDSNIEPGKAYYGTAKSEFFITLEDILSYDNPKQALCDFYQSGFEILAKHFNWPNMEWINKPLLNLKGSEAFRK